MSWNESEWCDLVGSWIALSPSRDAEDSAQAAVVRSIEVQLRALDFEVGRYGAPGRTPTLLARRGAGGPGDTVAIYNHYDVEPPGAGWTSDPTRLTARDGRYFGTGIADNLGPLALRLLASRAIRDWPPVVWLIEGEEELGSPSLDAITSELRALRPALWIDETGFFASDREQTLLTLAGSKGTPARGLAAVQGIAARRGVSTRIEHRRMNRFSPDGVSRLGRLMADAAYLAMGPNDGRANIHGADESLPRFSLDLCAAQWVGLFDGWSGRQA
jgi:acetylornithine deacetylase/succinyl-diaminopimelate desuccinylase-like protein